MGRKLIKNLLLVLVTICLIVTPILIDPTSNQVLAQEPPPEPPSELSYPGRIVGTGTFFEIQDSESANITLASTEEVRVVLDSIPRMITLIIEAAGEGTDNTVLTLEGLEPNKTYYKYEDDFGGGSAFISDGNGSHVWTQDLTQLHLVSIQEEEATISIPEQASTYGTWDDTTRTFTLEQDLTETVWITESNITLDGNGHTVGGTGSGYGILSYDTTDIIIKNFNIEEFGPGIYISSASNVTVSNCTVSNNSRGISFGWSSDIIINSNNFLNSGFGIETYFDSSNITISSNNVLSGLSGISILFDSSNITVNDNIVSNQSYEGIQLAYGCHNSNFRNNTVSNNQLGVSVWCSDDGNRISHNNFIDNVEKPQARVVFSSGIDLFDDGYPSGGNYWSDYTGVDQYRGPNQDQPGSDGIGDTPYTFYGGEDRYPFMYPLAELISLQVVQLEALDDFDIRDISDPIWTGDDPSQFDPIADGMREKFWFRTKSGEFKIKATIEASPSTPTWEPTCGYIWAIGISDKYGRGNFIGWDGEFEVEVPQKVGQYTLYLAFSLHDNEGNIINTQFMEHPLYVTYQDSILYEDSILQLDPKEDWLKKATMWASGATNPPEVAYSLLNGIYSTGWTYDPGGHWGWQYTLDYHTGDCRDYAWLWKNMNMVLGIPKDSKTIYCHFELRNAAGQVIDEGRKAFITKNLRSLDGEQREWSFNFHQIGSNGGFYDPVLNIYNPSKEEYEKELIKAFDTIISANGIWKHIRTEGSNLETLIYNKQISYDFSIGSESFQYILTLEDQSTVFADPPVNLTIVPAHDVIVLRTDKFSYDLDEPIYITAAYIYNGAALTGISFSAEVQRPDAGFNISLYDDGTHGDVQANDGIYSNTFTDTSVEGGYAITAHASGAIDGIPFEKEVSLPNSILITRMRASFTEEYSDIGTDVDADGFYDFLEVAIGLDVSVPGDYAILAILKGNDIDIATASELIYFTSGDQEINLSFDGVKIYKSGIEGPYTLHVYCYNEEYYQIDQKEYTTSPYNSTDFQEPAHRFTGTYSDYGTDTDSDGLYNYLNIDVGIEITAPGDYTVEGQLYDSNEELIDTADTSDYLNIGIQSLTLNFDGFSINQNQVDGPYYLKYLVLRNSDQTDFIDCVLDAYTTFAYSFADFQLPPASVPVLTGNYWDYGTDIDGDGIFDYLTLDIEVALDQPGYCAIWARLVDSNEEEIVWAENTAELEADQPQIIPLNFNGEAIYNHGIDGPYYLRDVYVYHTDVPTLPDYVSEAYTTSTYSYWQFGNLPPIADANGPYSGEEGSPVTLTASNSTDPNGDPLMYRWDFDNDGSWDTDWLAEPSVEHAWDDDYDGNVIVEVWDGELTDSAATTASISNVAPTIGEINAPLDPAQVGTKITASANFTDPGTADTHTAIWDWGDNTTSEGYINEVAGLVSGNHTYTAAGVYTVKLMVTDDDAASSEATFCYIVIYDPSAGFVTGGGWINSPEGAYVDAPSLTGKANLGFNVKYNEGEDIPTGQAQFNFKEADLKLHTIGYEWLAITGSKAIFKGEGTINGEGSYKFQVMVIDAEIDPNDDFEGDRFRIKIWEEVGGDEVVIYDNALGDDSDYALTELGGGSIVIHEG